MNFIGKSYNTYYNAPLQTTRYTRYNYMKNKTRNPINLCFCTVIYVYLAYNYYDKIEIKPEILLPYVFAQLFMYI